MAKFCVLMVACISEILGCYCLKRSREGWVSHIIAKQRGRGQAKVEPSFQARSPQSKQSPIMSLPHTIFRLHAAVNKYRSLPSLTMAHSPTMSRLHARHVHFFAGECANPTRQPFLQYFVPTHGACIARTSIVPLVDPSFLH